VSTFKKALSEREDALPWLSTSAYLFAPSMVQLSGKGVRLEGSSENDHLFDAPEGLPSIRIEEFTS
jgi:hypothetical protein